MVKKPKLKFIIIFIIIAYIGYAFVKIEISIKDKQRELSSYNKQIIELQEKNMKLKDEVKVSKTDEYMERQAREKCGLVKAGETPVINNGK